MQVKFMNALNINSGLILHGCNTEGVMGAGIALALSRKYPQILPNYKKLCAEAVSDAALLGTCDLVQINSDLFIGNCFTQTLGSSHNMNEPPARYGAVLDSVRAAIWSFHSKFPFYTKNLEVFMPPIGCGLGGLEWPIVNGLLEYLKNQLLAWNKGLMFELTVIDNVPDSPYNHM